MKKNKKLETNGYSSYEKKHYGWKMNTKKCFKFTSPDILS